MQPTPKFSNSDSYIFRLSVLARVAIILLFFPYGVSASEFEPRFGLWLEVEGKVRPFTSRKSFEEAISFIEEGEFTDVYCQVYRRGRSWFPSMVADDGPFRKAKAQGLDPLGELIERAHASGKRVHAWINVLRVKDNSRAPIFSIVGNDAAHMDNFGNSVLAYQDGYRLPPGKAGEYYQLDTPGIWLDPANPALRNYIVEVVRDLVAAYPMLDGVHLDMVRFSFAMPVQKGTSIPMRRLELGHSKSSVSGFEEVQRLAKPEGGADSSVPPVLKGFIWESWHRSQITTLVAQIRDLLRSEAPWMKLSVASIADPQRAKRSAYQDWGEWVKNGLISEVLPMAYTTDIARFRYYTNNAVQSAQKSDVLMGIGAWLMLGKSAMLLDQVKLALESGSEGVVLFSYANLASKRGRELVREVKALLNEHAKKHEANTLSKRVEQ